MVRLVPWAAEDFWLLERCNSPEMTAYLGGPETAEQLVSRQERYVTSALPGQMYVIRTAEDEVGGSIGYWEHEEAGETVWETGWAILPEQQGKGIATAAIAEVAKVVAAEGTHRRLHAYPGVDNAASNALCRKAGFGFRGERDFEYPKGHWMRCNDWALEL